MIKETNIPSVQVHRLGMISYGDAVTYQERLRDQLVKRKRFHSTGSAADPIHHLILCQHHPVFTLGRSGKMEHLLTSPGELEELEVDFFQSSRGGDITFHGPGQLVCYPIFDLDYFFTDIHKYVRFLEKAVIAVCADYGLTAFPVPDYTGVWLGEEQRLRKICAIGVHLSRWVTMHGLALNVATDLSYFERMIPCGINEENKSVTSLESELGRQLVLEQVGNSLLVHLARLFNFAIWKP